MERSAGNLSVVPGRTNPGLAVEPAVEVIPVRKSSAPNPYRVAVFLEAVDAWWDDLNIPVEASGGGA
jgi:hypothetical protein